MGTIGSTQHAANMLTAIYIATGQGAYTLFYSPSFSLFYFPLRV